MNNRLCLTTVLTVLASLLQLVQAQPVRFAPEADYGPFVYQDRDGKIKGLSIDYLQLIAQRSGLTLEMLPPQPLNQILQQARQGQVDVISSLRPDPERAAYLSFSAPYIAVPALLLHRDEANAASALSAYSGQAVAVGKGYAVESYVRQHYPNVLWRTYPDDQQSIGALLRREVNALVADAASISFLRRNGGYGGLKIGDTIGFNYALSMAYRKDRPELGEKLNEGLRQISPAEREQIYRRWIDEREVMSSRALPPSIHYAAIALLVLGVLILAWQLGRSGRSK